MDELRPFRQAQLALPPQITVPAQVEIKKLDSGLTLTEDGSNPVDVLVKTEEETEPGEPGEQIGPKASVQVKKESIPSHEVSSCSSSDQATVPAQPVLQLSATHRKKKRPATILLPTRRSKRQAPHLHTDSPVLKQEL